MQCRIIGGPGSPPEPERLGRPVGEPLLSSFAEPVELGNPVATAPVTHHGHTEPRPLTRAERLGAEARLGAVQVGWLVVAGVIGEPEHHVDGLLRGELTRSRAVAVLPGYVQVVAGRFGKLRL